MSTMRTSLVIEGDVSGAAGAAREVQGAIGETQRRARDYRGEAARTTRAGAELANQNGRLATSFRNMASAVSVVDGPLGGVASRFSAVGTLLSRTNVILAGFGAAAGLAVIGASRATSAFADYERQLLTTEAVLKATRGAAGRTGEQLEATARRLGRDTLASTQEAREAIRQLLTFRSVSGEVFDQAITLAQDLAATGFGTLSSNAVQLGKALEDPMQGLTALTRVGVSFSAAQKEVIRDFQETGRVAEAQRVILAAVEQQVGGAGRRAGEGIAGAWDTLRENMGLFMAQMGQGVTELSGLEAAVRAVGDAIGAGVDRANQSRLDGLREEAAALAQELADAGEQLRALSAIDTAFSIGPAMSAEAQAVRDGTEAIREKIAANREEMEVAQLAEDVRAAIAASRAADESRKREQEQIEGVMASLQEELEMARLSEVEKRILVETRKAGAAAASDEAAALAGLVRQIFAEADAAREAAAAQAELARQRAQAASAYARFERDRRMAEAGNDRQRALIAAEDDLALMEPGDRARAVGNILATVDAEERARARPRGGGAGRGAGSSGPSAAEREAAREREAVERLVASLRLETAIRREADPVRQEMLRLSDALRAATAAEREEVEALVRARIEEARVMEEVVADLDRLRAVGRDVLGGIADDLLRGASAADILGRSIERVGASILNAGLDRLGDSLFGARGSASPGVLGGILGRALPFARGGVVDRVTPFAFGGGQLGVMGEAGPEAILPLRSGAGGLGVGARIGGEERTLPLARLAGGDLGIAVSPFVRGGAFAGAPLARAGSPAAAGGGASRLEVVLSPDLAARMLERAGEQSVTITRGALREYDRALPRRVRRIEGDPGYQGS